MKFLNNFASLFMLCHPKKLNFHKDSAKYRLGQSSFLGEVKILSFVCLCSGFLASCAADSYEKGNVMTPLDFKGAVVADDSHTTIVGKEILTAGGNAFDAAAAMGFAMAVTLPSRAGLGAGGACEVFNPKTKLKQTLVFVDDDSSHNYAIPAVPRAMLALHAKGGKWQWERIPAAAEHIAKMGFVATKPYTLDNKKIKEGEKVYSYDLASSLSMIRSKALGGLYINEGARRFVSSASQIGVTFKYDDVRNFVPQWLASKSYDYKNDVVYFLPDSVSAYNYEKLWQENKNKVVIQNTKQTAGFAIVDAWANAVVCQFSMGNNSDKQKILPAMGINLARVQSLPSKNFGILMLLNDNVNEFKYMAYTNAKNAGEVLVQTTKDILAGNTEGKYPDNLSYGAIYCPQGLPHNPQTCRVINNLKTGAYGTVVY